MLTNLGKLLVLLNAFASVAVLSWAAAAFFTRVDAVDANPASEDMLRLRAADEPFSMLATV